MKKKVVTILILTDLLLMGCLIYHYKAYHSCDTSGFLVGHNCLSPKIKKPCYPIECLTPLGG